MTRFNAASVGTRTVNKAGGSAYEESDKLKLISLLFTSFTQNQFYRSGDNTLKELRALVAAIPDKRFVAKAALFARDRFNMRSITHVVAGELAKSVKGESWTGNFYKKLVVRPDDITETLSYYMGNYGKPIPNALKRGFAQALEGMDEYRLGKYKAEGKGLSMVDVVNLLHPKATDALTKLMTDSIKVETWETELSSAGNAEDVDLAKNAAWSKLLTENKLGYMALLRNLRNILEQAPESVSLACAQLVGEARIKKSRVLPFRFLTALDQIRQTNEDGTREVLIAISRALDIAVENVPRLPGKTLIALDVSGSMNGAGDAKSPAIIGSLFAACLYKATNADIIRFATDAEYVSPNPLDSTSTIADSLRGAGGGTNFPAIFETANRAYDRIIILSDMQSWMQGSDSPSKAFNEYCTRLGTRPKVFSFDLAGYGTLQTPEREVYCLAGFSEKVFDVMAYLEEDRNALIHAVEQVEL